jgi:hypothetical protein
VRALHEGAAEPLALLGLIRLVHYLSEPAALGRGPCDLVTDCGTGVTAIGAPPLSVYSISYFLSNSILAAFTKCLGISVSFGWHACQSRNLRPLEGCVAASRLADKLRLKSPGLALGVALLGLPWRIHGVMLAGTKEYYQQQQKDLTAASLSSFGAGDRFSLQQPYTLPVHIVQSLQCPRIAPLGVQHNIPRSHEIILWCLFVPQMRRWSREGALPCALFWGQGVCKIKAIECAGNPSTEDASGGALPLNWRPRVNPRKFGAVLPGDVTTCRQVRARCAPTHSLL